MGSKNFTKDDLRYISESPDIYIYINCNYGLSSIFAQFIIKHEVKVLRIQLCINSHKYYYSLCSVLLLLLLLLVLLLLLLFKVVWK